MDILINTLSITPTKGGIKTYLINLTKSLVKIDDQNRYIFLCSQLNRQLFESIAQSAPNCDIIMFSLSSSSALNRIWYDQWVIGPYANKFQQPILFNPLNIGSLWTNAPQITVIQTPFSIKSCRRDAPPGLKIMSSAHQIYYDLFMPLSLRKTKFAIAVSDSIAKYIIESYPFAKEKVRVVREGVDLEGFSPLVKPFHSNNKMDDTSYILFVSTLFPYKNADKLIQAFARLQKIHKTSSQLRLKLVGRDPDGHQVKKLRKLSHELGISSLVDFLGSVPHQDMAKFYQNAKVFVFPSSVETFGLPILEAMACGIPVVASNRMSVPEVVGDAGIVVNPDNIEKLADSISQVINHVKLQQEFIKKGLNRVQTFGWDYAASQVLALFDEMKYLRVNSN